MKKGFTLIELLVVISIIALLSSVVLAAVGLTRAKASIAAGQIFEGQMYQAYGANAVAIWNFDEGSGVTAYDTSGNNNNLTLSNSGGVLTDSVAWASTANAFRGKSAFIPTILSNPTPAPTPAAGNVNGFSTANGSISFWINLVQGSSFAGIFCDGYEEFCIYDSDNPTNGHFIGIQWNGGGTCPGSKCLFAPILTSSVANKWTNVALSWNSTKGTINIYVNGSLAASSSSYTAGFLGTPPYRFYIGGDGGNDDVIATLDEMRVYSQSLQTGEIQKIYAEELPHYEHLLADANVSGRK